MTSTFQRIAALHCPYCGSEFREQVRSDAECGVIKCGCGTYPVLDGIPVIQRVDGLQRVVDLVTRGESQQAVLAAMDLFRVKWARRGRWQQLHYRLACRRLLHSSAVTFEEALALVRKPQGFADYLFHRNANPSFLSDMALLPLASSALEAQDGRQRRVLDLACGAGHSSFLLSQWFPAASVVSVDEDFVSLYLAKRFLAPGAEFVCTDVEMPSPFPDRYFDVVHCLDAFHYFRSKRAIVAELRRIARGDAAWILPHLHNALQDNITPGAPLTPEHYLKLFEGVSPVMFDESDVLRATGGGLPFPRDVRELGEAKAVALVAGVDCSQTCAHSTRWLCRVRANLRMNPVYRATWRGESLRFEMRWPNPVLRRECRAVEEIMPREGTLNRDDLYEMLYGQGDLDAGLLANVRRFVLVPLAERYGRQDPLKRVATR